MSLYLGMDHELLVVDPERPEEAVAIFPGKRITAIAVAPGDPDRILCATSNEGLLRSVDAGNTWARVGEQTIRSSHVLSVAVSPANPALVFAGTEPSALYRSDDGGDTWRELTALQDMPSKPSWSVPLNRTPIMSAGSRHIPRTKSNCSSQSRPARSCKRVTVVPPGRTAFPAARSTRTPSASIQIDRTACSARPVTASS